MSNARKQHQQHAMAIDNLRASGSHRIAIRRLAPALLAALLGMSLTPAAGAGMPSKCIDADGKPYFTDQRCPEGGQHEGYYEGQPNTYGGQDAVSTDAVEFINSRPGRTKYQWKPAPANR